MTDFAFNDISSVDLGRFVNNSKVFNTTRDKLGKEVIFTTFFEDDRLGSSIERVDIAVYNNGNWSLLDFDYVSKFLSDGSVSLSAILAGYSYDRVLVITRRMSNLIIDKVSFNEDSFILSIVSSGFEGVVNSGSLIGKLAKLRIYLNGTLDDVISSIKNCGLSDSEYDSIVRDLKVSFDNTM